MKNLHISISAEPIFHFGSLTLTNSMLVSWLVTGSLVAFALYAYRKIKPTDRPTGLQGFLEMIIDSLHRFAVSIVSEAKANQFFPLFATFFIFILLANWVGLVPGVGTIGFLKSINQHQQFVPLLRGATADINITLSLAIISVFSLQYFGLKNLGLGYLNRYFNFQGPIQFFIGLLELFSDLAKIISFAFRLFGNIFAGEVLITVTAALMPLFAPLPFIGLEIFVGLIQALVFATLTLVFLNIATAHEPS